MKLFFSPGACSLSPHIALREAGLPFDLVKVDLASKKTQDGQAFTEVNPKSYVPALTLPDNSVLTEGPAIVQYVADQAPERKLAPAAGSIERYRLMELLNFISTELHKGFSPLFHAKTPEEAKTQAREQLNKRLGAIAEQLSADDRPYLMGKDFSVADGYLFTVLRWAPHLKVDLSPWPALGAFVQRVGQRPAVQAALRAEGLPVPAAEREAAAQH